MRCRCWKTRLDIRATWVVLNSVSLLVQVLHLPSSCLGGMCCQWDQTGVFAGLYLVWTLLTSPSSCCHSRGCWGALVATLLVALPWSQPCTW